MTFNEHTSFIKWGACRPRYCNFKYYFCWQDTLDFVAYVAKDLRDWRACYVLECGGGLAQDVITSIGQAFRLRFKEFLTMPSNQSVLH